MKYFSNIKNYLIKNKKLNKIIIYDYIIKFTNIYFVLYVVLRVWSQEEYAQWLYLISFVGLLTLPNNAVLDSYILQVSNNRFNLEVLKKNINIYLNVGIYCFFIIFFLFILLTYSKFKLNIFADSYNAYIALCLMLKSTFNFISTFIISYLRIQNNYLLFLIKCRFIILLDIIVFLTAIYFFNSSPIVVAIYLMVFSILFMIYVIFNKKIQFIKFLKMYYTNSLFSYSIFGLWEQIKITYNRFVLNSIANFKYFLEIIFLSNFFNGFNLIKIITLLTFVKIINFACGQSRILFNEQLSINLAKKKFIKFKEQNLNYLILIVFIIFLISMFLYFVGQPFYDFWTNHLYEFDYYLFCLFITSFSIHNLWKANIYQVELFANQYCLELLSKIIFIVLVLNFVALYFFIKYIGVHGIGYAFIMYELIMLLMTNIVVKKQNYLLSK